MNEYASSGTYYFSSGRILVDSFKDLMKNDLNINGEYYVSLCYKSIIKSGKSFSLSFTAFYAMGYTRGSK